VNKTKWVYIGGDSARQSIVGALHSPKLGYLIVYCEDKIVLAERNVFDNANFSFFLEDELCTISVTLNNGVFSYGFSYDTQVKTPLNILRNKTKLKNIYQTTTAFSILFAFVSIAMIIVFTMQDTYKWESLRDFGVLEVATIELYQKENDLYITYVYRDSTRYSVHVLSTRKSINSNPVLENGFPVQSGDEFLVTYSFKEKVNHKLHLNYPTAKTINRYRALAKSNYLKNNTKHKESYCDCILDIAYNISGWRGYAAIYHQKTLPSALDSFNQERYEAFIREPAFLKQEVQCWQFR
jgi:hypothetical protein